MDTLLVKVFATALTLSQAMTAPDAFKTRFDPAADQGKVVSLLRDGCAHMRKVFEIEDLNLDDLIATALEDPALAAGEYAAFRGIKFTDLQNAYRAFCTDAPPPQWDFDPEAVIDFYNKTVADLPDPTRLKDLRLGEAALMLDRRGERFREVFDTGQRRISVPLAEIPQQVRQAFVSAEDKRFYEHAGIDERALLRAVLTNMAQSGRPQGASTITQQVVKNLLAGDDVSYERKIREVILATQVERVLSKDEILELYLNTIYLGRGSWGVEMAARSYFGKSVRDLNLAETALLAGLPKGPSYFSPDRYPERMRERRAYVLSRMQEDGAITAEQARDAQASTPTLIPFERPQADFGFYFADQATREARMLAAGDGITAKSYTVHTTIDVPLQRGVEEALQEGLWHYESNAGRVRFQGPEANLASSVARIESERSAESPHAGRNRTVDKRPAWQRALAEARLPLYDVHWTPATVLQGDSEKRRSGQLQIGLADGRILPLTDETRALKGNIKQYDVIFVHVSQSKSRPGARAQLRVRPEVQGAAVVLENATGRILAMTGGFSYPLSQFNRVTQAQRQPGSAIKPLSYLAALKNGLEPNTLIRDEPITFPPIGGRGEEWSPKNYEGGSSGILTLRQALENSRNLATVHLLDGGIDSKPEKSLDRLCALALQLRIYRDCVRFYPFVLGAEPVRPIDLAGFYAAIANEGVRPEPHAIEAIEQGGNTHGRDAPPPASVSGSDRAVFYQLKTMLQGVLQRGTARALAPLAPYMAGKTGTTEDFNDAWFVGFTNEITVAVWVGYDNPGGTRRTLGEGATGAAVAAPIVQSIIEAAWSHGMSKSPLAPPSAEATSRLSCKQRNFETSPRRRSTTECLRLDAKGEPIEARYRLVLRENSFAQPNRDDASSRASRPPSALKPPSDQPSPAAGYNWFDWWGGGWRDHQPGSQMQPRGF